MKKRTLLILTAICMLISTASAQAATCSGTSCNGQDPYTTGCWSDSYSVKSGSFVDETSMTLGYVYVMYSPTCQTVWTEVYSDFSPTNHITANIYAPDSTSVGCSTSPPWVCYAGYETTLYDGSAFVNSAMQLTPAPSDATGCGNINVTYSSIWGTITTQQSACAN